jgi:hypothetical protein
MKGLGLKKNPVTSSGMELATSRIVAVMKTTETSVKILGAQTNIITWDVPNTIRKFPSESGYVRPCFSCMIFTQFYKIAQLIQRSLEGRIMVAEVEMGGGAVTLLTLMESSPGQDTGYTDRGFLSFSSRQLDLDLIFPDPLFMCHPNLTLYSAATESVVKCRIDMYLKSVFL